MRYILIIAALMCAANVHSQIKSTIILGPGEGGPVSGPADSMGLVIPLGEIVIGTGSKAPGSTDSLLWNAGLFVDAPLNLTGLAAGAVDSFLYIDVNGFVGKHSRPNIYTGDGTLSGTRTLNGGGYNLTFTNTGNLSLRANGSWLIGNVGVTGGVYINGLPTIGLQIETTGSTADLFLTSGDDLFMTVTDLVDVSSGRIILDAPQIFLEDPLNLIIADTILVRNNVTGEIQGRLASTIAGSDSLGRNGTPGQIVFETATKAPNSDPGLFWDNTSKRLGIGTSSPASDLTLYKTSGNLNLEIDASDAADAFIFFENPTVRWAFRTSTNQLIYRNATAGTNIMNIFADATTNTLNLLSSGVGIGTTTPVTSAKLEVFSTTGAVLVTRLTTTQRDALTPVNGMILYNSTTAKMQAYAGGAWVDLH